MIDAAVGFLIAALMGMGVGGGGLLVIYLTLVLNYNQINAQGTNLIFFIFAVVSSFFIHISKRKLNYRLILVMALFGMAGSLITSVLANSINPKIPRIILGCLLIVSGVLTIFKTVKDLLKEKK